MIRVDLPFPHKLLWPNGSRGTHRAVAGQKKAHRAWADLATVEAMAEGSVDVYQRPIPIKIIVHAKPEGPLPDRDNCVAAAKSLLDGIAQRLGVNDIAFAAPTVEFAMPRDGRFVIEVG